MNPGSNEIRRKSVQSSVTIPYERSLKWIASQDTPSGDDSEFSFCGCGWPEHLLLPKGTVGGTKFTVFVMISDYANDQVGEEPNGYVFEIIVITENRKNNYQIILLISL